MLQEVTKVFGYVSKCKVSLVAFALVCICSLASAQTPITIPVDVPEFDYAGVATTLLSMIGVVAAAAIGLGLSIWCVRFVYRLFKSMAR